MLHGGARRCGRWDAGRCARAFVRVVDVERGVAVLRGELCGRQEEHVPAAFLQLFAVRAFAAGFRGVEEGRFFVGLTRADQTRRNPRLLRLSLQAAASAGTSYVRRA